MKIWFWILLLFSIVICIFITIKIINDKNKRNQDDDIYPLW
jgi:uncharacterized protein YneF (UPF0154 family)